MVMGVRITNGKPVKVSEKVAPRGIELARHLPALHNFRPRQGVVPALWHAINTIFSRELLRCGKFIFCTHFYVGVFQLLTSF
jgi:hypothetical protein